MRQTPQGLLQHKSVCRQGRPMGPRGHPFRAAWGSGLGLLLVRTGRACIARISADSCITPQPGTLGSWKPVRGNRPGHPSWTAAILILSAVRQTRSEVSEFSPRDGNRVEIERKSVGIAKCEGFFQDLPSPGRAIACNSRFIGLLVCFPALAREETVSLFLAWRLPSQVHDVWMAWPLPKSSPDPHEQPRGGKSTGAGPNSQRPDPAHVCCRRPG